MHLLRNVSTQMFGRLRRGREDRAPTNRAIILFQPLTSSLLPHLHQNFIKQLILNHDDAFARD